MPHADTVCYRIVESTLETRTRRLERLEAMARDGVGEQSAIRTEAAKLRTENRLLKVLEMSIMIRASRSIILTICVFRLSSMLQNYNLIEWHLNQLLGHRLQCQLVMILPSQLRQCPQVCLY